MATEILTPASTSPWVCPAHVHNVNVQCWGSGGGGAGDPTASVGADGGGGGAYSSTDVGVVPGNSYDFSMGGGGQGGNNDNGSNGSTTSFDNTYSAAGGKGGLLVVGQGAGGLASDSFGSIVYDGGTGGSGDGGFNAGGGGGSASPSGNGNNASGSSGGSGHGSGDGGNGGSISAGQPGGTPGGGGGAGTGDVGGAGGDGQIVLTYDFEPSVTDTLSLSETATGARAYNRSGTDAIVFEEVNFINRERVDLNDSTHEFFNEPGVHSFTVPSGVHTIVAECWGAGGGSSGLLIDNSQHIYQGGYGGGGGGYARRTFPVSPGDVFDVYVGYGGSGISDNDGSTGPIFGFDISGQDGEDSSFGNNSNCVGLGGAGGHFVGVPIGFGTYLAVGNGGAGGSGIGIVTFDGGAGADAANASQPGGGGGAAGNTENGSVGTLVIGGAGGILHGGQGGSPGTLADPQGVQGEQPGGGGGGSRTTSTAGISAYGGHGKVIVSYEVERVQDTVVLDETAINTAVRPKSVSEAIVFVESALSVNSTNLAVSDTLVFTELATRIPPLSITETIVFVETAIGAPSRPVSDTLVISETISIAGSTFRATVTDNLNFSEDTTRHIFVVCIDKFSPSPSLGIRTTTSLYYPYTSPTNTVNLRNPKYGNILRLETGKIVRRSRGGKQLTGRVFTWLNLYSLQLQFEQLTIAQATGLIDLLVACAGDEIKLLDWENRTWRCIVISEPNDIIQNKDDDCQYSATLKLQGVLV